MGKPVAVFYFLYGTRITRKSRILYEIDGIRVNEAKIRPICEIRVQRR
jgi:hypothetical protein